MVQLAGDFEPHVDGGWFNLGRRDWDLFEAAVSVQFVRRNPATLPDRMLWRHPQAPP
jgi:hypothetical protein